MNHGKVLPVPDTWSTPFWQAARRGELVLQRCTSCGDWQHPPLPVCSACNGREFGYEPVSGRGSVYTFTVTHRPLVPGAPDVPYAVVVAELDEQVGLRLVANLVGSPVDQLCDGDRVAVAFEDAGQDGALPQFRIAEGGGNA